MRAIASTLPMLALISAAGCATQSHQAPSAQVNLSGYSAAFRQGYNDGCDSARASLRRDEKRYLGAADYKAGWNDGFSVCQSRRLPGR